jgi:hypothetical protein
MKVRSGSYRLIKLKLICFLSDSITLTIKYDKQDQQGKAAFNEQVSLYDGKTVSCENLLY